MMKSSLVLVLFSGFDLVATSYGPGYCPTFLIVNSALVKRQISRCAEKHLRNVAN